MPEPKPSGAELTAAQMEELLLDLQNQMLDIHRHRYAHLHTHTLEHTHSPARVWRRWCSGMDVMQQFNALQKRTVRASLSPTYTSLSPAYFPTISAPFLTISLMYPHFRANRPCHT